MALPTPVKTWLFSANNTLPTNGSSNTDSTGRTQDIADFLGTVVTQLLTLGAPSGVSLVGSSDGRSNISPSTMNGTNLWLSGSSAFRSNMYEYFQYYGPATKTMWAVLQLPDGQLALVFHWRSSTFRALWSPGSLFVAPSDSMDLPSAVDAQIVQYWASGSFNNYGMWNHDSQGIINTSNNYASYTQKVQVGLANDGKGFYAVSFRANVPCFMMWFGKLQSPITSAPPYDWSAAYVMMMSGSQSIRQITGPHYDSSGFQPRSSLDVNAARFMVPCINTANTNGLGGNYDGFAGNPYQYNGVMDPDSGTYTLAPIGMYSPTRTGVKGILTDLWWGPGNGNTYTYPASTLTPNFFQANDLVFPWDGVTSISFS